MQTNSQVYGIKYFSMKRKGQNQFNSLDTNVVRSTATGRSNLINNIIREIDMINNNLYCVGKVGQSLIF